jgi:holo-[acyl-carrier protein] synthase
VRIGVDLADVSRVGRIAAHPRYRTLVFTARELALVDGCSPRRTAECMAGRFAAKEAVAKALKTGLLGKVRWLDIEIVDGKEGEPAVWLHRGAAEAACRQEIVSTTVSISHQGPFAVAVAVAMGAGMTPAR